MQKIRNLKKNGKLKNIAELFDLRKLRIRISKSYF